MATKKQRRRRAKLQRHEYEYIVETEEGEEVVVEPPRATRAQGGGAQKNVPPGAIVDRRGRVIQKPTWGRVLKRGAIFGPLLILLMFALGGEISTGAKIVQAVIMLLIFLPMSYLTDLFIYRSVAKRQGNTANR